MTEEGISQQAVSERIAPLLNADGGVATSAAMTSLIGLIAGVGPVATADQAAVIQSLKATSDAELLHLFLHSNGLTGIGNWLAQSQHAQHTLVLLQLFGHLPMDVQSLQASGVGKTVNKLRKSSDAPVQSAAMQLLQSWKAMAASRGTSESAQSAKRAASTSATEAEPKRSRPSAPAVMPSFDEDDSLDTALSAQNIPRKASLKPDHLRARRSVQQLVTMPPPASRNSQPSQDSTAHSTPSPGKPQSTPCCSPAVAGGTPSADVKPSKRVKWADGEKLVELREYLVEAKRAPNLAVDFHNTYQADLERERHAWQQRQDSEQSWVSALDMCSSEAPASTSAPAESATPPGPHPTVAWTTPPVLDERLWPEVKGDSSAERELQRQRRSQVLQVAFRGLDQMAKDPADEPPISPDSGVDTPVIPWEKVATAAPAPSASVLSGGPMSPPDTTGSWPQPEGGNCVHQQQQLQPAQILQQLMGAAMAGQQANGASALGPLPLGDREIASVGPNCAVGGQQFQNVGVCAAGGLATGSGSGVGQGSSAMSGEANQCTTGVLGASGNLAVAGGSIGGSGCLPGMSGMQAMGPGSAGACSAGQSAGIGATGCLSGAPGCMTGVGAVSTIAGGAAPMGGAGVDVADGGQMARGGSNLTEKLMLQMMLQNSNSGMQNSQGRGHGFSNGGNFNPGFDRPQWRDMSTHPKYKTKPCRYFSAGGCKNGDRCTFLHDPNFVGDPNSDDFGSHKDFNGHSRFGFGSRG